MYPPPSIALQAKGQKKSPLTSGEDQRGGWKGQGLNSLGRARVHMYNHHILLSVSWFIYCWSDNSHQCVLCGNKIVKLWSIYCGHRFLFSVPNLPLRSKLLYTGEASRFPTKKTVCKFRTSKCKVFSWGNWALTSRWKLSAWKLSVQAQTEEASWRGECGVYTDSSRRKQAKWKASVAPTS